MKDHLDNLYTNKRRVTYANSDVIKLDIKCLYAGKLERIKKWREKPHSHPCCEIMFVFSGDGQTVIKGQAHPIKKGDIIIYNPHVIHEELTTSQSGLEMGFFGITNFKINDLPSDHLISHDAVPIIHTGKDEDKMSFYFKNLVDELQGDEKYKELIVKYLARLILIDILRQTNISEAKFVTNAIFNQMHNYINNNFTKINSMEQICEELHVSKYYISHVFKKYIGKAPMQYVTSKRIDYAKKLLQETDLSATEIGEKCGYADHALFFKAFKRLEDTTPIAFRKETASPALKEQN